MAGTRLHWSVSRVHYINTNTEYASVDVYLYCPNANSTAATIEAILVVEPIDGMASTSVTATIALNGTNKITLTAGGSSQMQSQTKTASFTTTNAVNDFSLRCISYAGSSYKQDYKVLSGNIYWTTAPPSPSTTGPWAPTNFKINGGSNVQIAVPGSFQLTWNAGTAGTNNAITGYHIYSKRNNWGNTNETIDEITVSASSRSYTFSKSNTGAIGHSYIWYIETVGASNNSAPSASTVSVDYVSAVTNYTITLNPNGGSVSPTSKSLPYGTTVAEVPIPTRSGYKFLGWYTNHANSSITYGASYKFAGAVSLSFWTYKENYAASATYDISIISCTQGAGYAFYISSDGKTVKWEARTGNNAYNTCTYSTSNVSAGYHFWNCIFTGAGKKLQLYMDGTKVSEVSTTNTTISYNSANHVLAGAEASGTAGGVEWSNFTGKIGNLIITNDVDIRSQADTLKYITVPHQNTTFYAQWSASLTINGHINGGSLTTGPSGATTQYRVSSSIYQRSTNTGSSWSNMSASWSNPDDDGSGIDNWNYWGYGNGSTRAHYYVGSATGNSAANAFRTAASGGNIINADGSNTVNPPTWQRILGHDPTFNEQALGASATLYLNWVARTTYTVSYKKGANGTGTESTATKYHGESLTLKGAQFTRTGYTQTGWATSDGGSQAYALSASYTGNAALTLYPVWTGNTYTVTLNQQSGSGGTTSVTARYGSAMPAITVPTRTGYTFGGYYDGTGGSGTQYYTATGASARAWNKTAATTLYAKWTAKTYTVTVNLNGGTGGPGTSFTATYDTNKSLAAPTRAGYNFVGWACLSGSRLSQDFSAATGFFTAVPAKYIWGSSGTNNSTLSLVNMDTGSGFAASGNSAKMLRIVEPGTSTRPVGFHKAQTGSASTDYLIVFVAKAPLGTYFMWATNTIGTGGYHQWLTPPSGTGDWKTYVIKVHYGTGTVSSCGFITAGGSSTSLNNTSTPPAATVDYAWYGFGLYSKFNGACTYVPGDLSSDTIYALWAEKPHTVSYNLNGGSLPSGLNKSETYSSDGSKRGVNPEGTYWHRSGNILESNVNSGTSGILNHPASWYKVENPTKAAAVSSSTSPLTTTYSAASAVTATGSTKTVTTTTPQVFNGWNITGMDSSVHHIWTTTDATTSATTIASGTTLSKGTYFYDLNAAGGTVSFAANWINGTASTSTTYSAITLPNVPAKANTTSTITRTVNYNANGGSSTPSSQSVSPTAPITWTSDSKWYTTSALTTAAGIQGGSYTPQASGTLYAKYTSTTGSYNSPSLTLASAISKTATTSTATTTFNVNGGSGSNTSKTNTVTQNYNFNGWAKGSTTGATVAAGSSYTPDASSITMYATWANGTKTGSSITTPVAPTRVTTSSVTINYNSDGGSSVSSSTSTKTDTYPFSGWALGSTAGSTVGAGANINPTASTTYYAKWGTAAVTYSAVTLPTTPTKAGYKLVGWTDGTTTYTTTYTPNSASAVTLTAVWQQAGTVMVYSTSDNKWHWAIPYVYKTSDSKWHMADAYIYKGNTWKKCGL